MHPIKQELVDNMNVIHGQPDKIKLAIALLYPLSVIEVNLVRIVSMSAGKQMTVTYTTTKSPKVCSTYRNVFDKGVITKYALTMCHKYSQVFYNACVYGNQAEKLTGVL